MGRQSQLMWVGIAGFWFCGVPLGYTLAFPTHFGLSGLWLGSLTGALIVCKSPSTLGPSHAVALCQKCLSDKCTVQRPACCHMLYHSLGHYHVRMLMLSCLYTLMTNCAMRACTCSCFLFTAPVEPVLVAACRQALLALLHQPWLQVVLELELLH